MSGKSSVGRISKKRKTITLENKLDILRRFDNGEKAADIAKALNLAATTVRAIQARDRTKIKEAAKSVTSLDAKTMTRTRSGFMIKMESLLSIWIQNQIAQKIPLRKMVIQAKEKSLFDGYIPKQVFNVDETGLFWKRLPKKTFISKTEKSAPGFKASKDRLTLLLGGNANGDFKFKPLLVYKSENPRSLKDCSKDQLCVPWRANKKAWMTALLFKNWVSTCAIPEIKAYCNKENLDFKALVLVDNAHGHPVYIDDLSENVKFLFLPPNTTSLIHWIRV